MKQHGLTLIELLAALAVMGVLAAIALPAFAAMVDAQRRQDAAQQLSSGLRLARSEAILRGQPVMMQALEDDWSRGWQVFVDSNQNLAHDRDEPLLVERSAYPQVRVAGNSKVASRVGFDSTGRPLNNANGTLAVCLKDTPASHSQVVIAVTGRVTLRREGFASEPCA